MASICCNECSVATGDSLHDRNNILACHVRRLFITKGAISIIRVNSLVYMSMGPYIETHPIVQHSIEIRL